MRRFTCMGGCAGAIALAVAAAEIGGRPARIRVGNALGAEHVAFVRAGVPGGLVGPARQCAAGDPRDIRCCMTPDGALWVADSRDCLVYRIKDGQARIAAGCGVKGYRDGPADRAMFDFGVGSYCDVEVNADAAGNLYVSDMMNNAIRKIHKTPDGTWRVATVCRGSPKGRVPNKGEWIPANQLRFGGASRFAVADDGTITYAIYGGIHRVKGGKATLLATSDELRAALGGRRALSEWHVGGSHITPDGVFYWSAGGQEIYRLDTKTGRAEVFAGEGPKRVDKATPRQSGFHTVVIVYSRDASVIYTGGGDESHIRRIAGGTVKHIQKDGTLKATTGRDRENWRLGQPVCLGPEGEVYAFPSSYAWSCWLVRVRFAEE